MQVSIAATSATVRPMGPITSLVKDMGIVPDRPTSPDVGFMPTTPHNEDGITIDP